MLRGVLGIFAGAIVWMAGFYALVILLAALWPDFALHGRVWQREGVFAFTPPMGPCGISWLAECQSAVTMAISASGSAPAATSPNTNEWSRFGRLSNNEPLSQGRHRGNFPGKLRSATDEELVEARTFARKLLLAFLQYLMRSGRP